MTREMYERALARMREVGQVTERPSVGAGIHFDSATVVWTGPIAEAAEVIRHWGELVCETGGFLDVHIFRGNAYERAEVKWVVYYAHSDDEVAAQEAVYCARVADEIAAPEVERCAG